MQTVPGYAKGIADGLPKFVAQEGVGGLFKGLTPLWGRQIPYTMMKFGELFFPLTAFWGRYWTQVAGAAPAGGAEQVETGWLHVCSAQLSWHGGEGGGKREMP